MGLWCHNLSPSFSLWKGVVEIIKFSGERIDRWSFLPPQVITFVVLSGALPFFNSILHKLLVGPDGRDNKLKKKKRFRPKGSDEQSLHVFLEE